MTPLEDRRHYQRLDLEIPVSYRCADGGLRWTRTFNLSAGGAKIRTLEPVAAGTQMNVSVHVPGPQGEKVFSSPGEVVWVKREAPDQHGLSCGVVFKELMLEIAELV